jgi:hypothetical protein
MKREKRSDDAMLEDLLGLNSLNNFWGHLDKKIKARLVGCFKNPDKYWNDTYSIILRSEFGLGMTLWQAWIVVNPSAPRIGPAYDKDGKMVRDWEVKPCQRDIYEVIRYAASTKTHKVGL